MSNSLLFVNFLGTTLLTIVPCATFPVVITWISKVFPATDPIKMVQYDVHLHRAITALLLTVVVVPINWFLIRLQPRI